MNLMSLIAVPLCAVALFFSVAVLAAAVLSSQISQHEEQQ